MKKISLFLNSCVIACFLVLMTGNCFAQTATRPSVGDGSESNPYEIATLDNLYWLSQNRAYWSLHYIQTADIDASSTSSWDDGSGFSPIGNNGARFWGSYDGKGYSINNLFIYRPDEEYIGLFGWTGSSSQINNIRVTNLNITGKKHIGGLVGNNNSAINNCCTTGKIESKVEDYNYAYTGGFVGYNYREITACYSSVDITMSSECDVAGGFVGTNWGSSAIISNCYSRGTVSGDSQTGGFVGYNASDAVIRNSYSTGKTIGNSYGGFSGKNTGIIDSCFWDTETSELTYSRGGTGLTAAEMKDLKTYLLAEWDFMGETYLGTNDYWGLNSEENDGYLFLSWQGYTNNSSIACQAPLAPAKNMMFEDVQSNSIILKSFTRGGYITEGYVIYINTEDNWTIPNDNNTPAANANWQNNGQQCIYFGTSNNPDVKITGLNANTKYYFKIYGYNSCSGTLKYENTGVVESRFTSVPSELPSGDGSESNPYVIASIENLAWLMYNSTEWDKHYIQTINIDASSTSAWNDGAGIIPIGNLSTKFSGTYNGKLHSIDGLYIKQPDEDYIGLFGYISSNSRIDSLGVVNVDITGRSNIGGICGYNEGTISSCYSDGSLQSTMINTSNYSADIGGLVGCNKNYIAISYSKANVSSPNGGRTSGGFVGLNSEGTIKNCYSMGTVTGFEDAGGFAGRNNGVIENSYSTGKVDVSYPYSGFISSSYYTSKINSCFWDIESSEMPESIAGTGLNSSQMKDMKTYLNANWDFLDESYIGTDDIWGINSNENYGYPFLKWQGYSHEGIECQSPISSVSEISFGTPQSNSINLKSFERAGYITEGYAIYVNTENNWITPSDGSTPTADVSWKNNGQQCIYLDTSSTPDVTVTGLLENTKYFLKIYAYNICGGSKIYETTGKDTAIYTGVVNTLPTGEGTEENPYVIASLENLAWLMYNKTAWNKYFIQTTDIDASDTKNWEGGAGFTPIGNSTTQFTGKYNGKLHTIDGLFINRPTDKYIGLFGSLRSANIDSLGVTNIDFTGYSYMGGLAGSANYGVMRNCYSTGELANIEIYDYYNQYVGGLIGYNYTGIKSCFSNVHVNAENTRYVGGLVGYNGNNGYSGITNCYSIGDVTGYTYVGGLAGYNSATINNCYSTGKVNSPNSKGGLVCYNYGEVISSLWDTETSGLSTSSGGTGLTTSQMKNFENYLNHDFDFMDETINGSDDYWGHNSSENNAYPFLKWQGYENNVIVTCQAPFVPASKISFGNTQANSITLDNFEKAGYATKGYAIYINTEDTWVAPIDGEEPTANTVWQNSGQQCIYFGTLTTPDVTITGLSANTKYYFKVFAYNICADNNVYETEGALATNITRISNTKPSGEGTESNPYVIANLENLAWLMYNSNDWDKHYIQSADIDATPNNNWQDTKGFIPIGKNAINFSGSYNGKGHIIDNLYINRPKTMYVGLFGYVNDNATIDSLGVTNVDISGYKNTGALVGRNDGIVAYCFTTGAIKSELDEISDVGGFIGINTNNISNCFSNVNISTVNGKCIGGFIGSNHSKPISNCYSMGEVSGNEYVGGFAGQSYSNLVNCYSTGKVNSTSNNPGTVGGFTGSSYSHYVTNCFWDTETSGISDAGSGTGLTTAEMKNFKNYLGKNWDFIDETFNGTDDIWGQNSTDNNGYPFLKWQGYTNDVFIDCYEPLSPVSNIIFGKTNTSSINLESFEKAGYVTEGYVIYINSEDYWTTPVNDATPTADTEWKDNGQQCVYFGLSNNPAVTVTGLLPNTNYYFKVFAYNICDGIIKYETTGSVANKITRVVNTKPSGEGTESNPYIIANLENLTWLMYNNTEWNKHLIQSADIDATPTQSWIDTTGFYPIGNHEAMFKGIYNGKGYTIDGLYINNQSNYCVGLFGCIGDSSIVSNLGITNVNIIGSRITGSLAGYNEGTIKNCFSTGELSSLKSYPKNGGLIGVNDKIIETSYSHVNITDNNEEATAGGLVGENYGIFARISNCYSMGNVTGHRGAGGLVGRNNLYAGVSNSYSTSKVIGNSDIGGLVGSNNNGIGLVKSSFWDIETSGITEETENTYCTGLNTFNMKTKTSYLNENWDFMNETINGTNDYWGLNEAENNGYPFLKWQAVANDTEPPTINCIGNQEIEITDSESVYSVTGDEFDLVTIEDNYGVTSIENDFNYEETLNGAEFPVGTTTVTWTVTDIAGNTSQCSFDVIVTKATGINSMKTTDILIYPNPVNDKLFINCENNKIDRLVLVDITGKVLLNKQNISGKEVINLSGFKSGMYLIQINQEQEIHTTRIIKN